MARPLRIEYAGAFYHLTVRGNELKDIFWDDIDRERFLGYLETAVVRYKAVIHAYCLMDNHYHLLLSTPGGIRRKYSKEAPHREKERTGHPCAAGIDKNIS